VISVLLIPIIMDFTYKTLIRHEKLMVETILSYKKERKKKTKNQVEKPIIFSFSSFSLKKHNFFAFSFLMILFFDNNIQLHIHYHLIFFLWKSLRCIKKIIN